MKKRVALLLGVLFTLVAAFASCGQTVATDRNIRWQTEEGKPTYEKYTFNITLSDFADSGNNLFKEYTEKFKKKGDDGNLSEVSVTCYKDSIISTNEASLMYNADQIRPVDARGTYTMDISINSTSVTLVTKQILYCQYKTEDLQRLGCLNTFKDSEYDYTAKEENPFENNDALITLHSVTDSEVVFANNINMTPSSSKQSNKGFYIGKTAQTVSEYSYETTYDLDNNKVTVKKNGSDTAEERKLNLAKNAICIDASQLLLYIRILDKSSAAFQDSPSVSVYDVVTDSVNTASFALNRQFNLILDNKGEKAIVSVNAVTATVGGTPFIAQYNLPDVSAIGDGFDYLALSGARRPKYTTVKFRSGWFSYDMQPDEYYQQAINAIKVKSDEA